MATNFNNEALLAAAAQMLGASGPSRQPVGLGQILGGGMSAYMGADQAAKQRKLEEDQQRQMAELRALQMQGMQGNLMDAETARRTPKEIEYSTAVQVGRDPDGKTFSYLTGKDGSIKRLDGVLPRDPLKLAKMGGKDVAYDEFALKPGQEFAHTPSADTTARLSFDKQKFAYEKQRDVRSDTLAQQKVSGDVAAPVKETPAGTRVREARDVLDLLDMAEPLLAKSTGSYIGAAGDQVARAFGKSTEGAQAAAQLKVVQAALVSKMPKMTGPQSDKDVQLYREAAGQMGDSTLPVEQRQAASRTIRTINEKYANEGGASADWTPAPKPNAAPAPKAATPKSVLRGQVVKGYRFKGGDPSVQSNWEKI